MGTSFTKFTLFFHKVFFTMNTLFAPLRETLCAGFVNFFVEALPLFTHVVFQLVVVRQTAFSESNLQGPKKTEDGGC